MWIMAILSLLALGFGFRSLIEMRLSGYNLDRLRARYLAKAGIVKVKEHLGQKTPEYDRLYECGISLEGKEPRDIFKEELGPGNFSVHYQRGDDFEGSSFQYGIVDEERKININFSKFGTGDRNEFKQVLARLSPELTEEVVNAIIDWQDADTALSLPGGAESGDYEFLDNPYECRNADFEFLEELLLVKGVTAGLFAEIKGYLTVYGAGRVNINTAAKKVLNAVINDDSGSYTALVERIVDFRKGDDREEFTPDDAYFTSIEDVKVLAENSAEASRLNTLRTYFIFKSDNYRVVSEGTFNKAFKALDCVLKRNPGPEGIEIVYYHEE